MAAFTPSTFSGNVGSGLASRLFTYKTADTKTETIASGYFNDIADLLNVGDHILAVTDTGTTAVSLALYVASNDGSTVTTGYAAVA